MDSDRPATSSVSSASYTEPPKSSFQWKTSLPRWYPTAADLTWRKQLRKEIWEPSE